MSDRPDGGSPNPFDPFSETPAGPAAGAEPDPEFDPEVTTRVTPPATPSPPSAEPPADAYDDERTTTVTPPPPPSAPAYGSPPAPGPPSTYGQPGPVSWPPAGQQSAYAPPPVFTAQYAPQQQVKNRRPMIIAVVGAAVALVVTLVVVVAVSVGGGGGGSVFSGGGATTAKDAVQGYLDALAKGNAKAALAFGSSTPGSTELLTDDVLEKQIKNSPITDVKILDDGSPVGDFARVHVSAKFGGQTSDTQLTVRKSGDEWKLPNAAVKLDFTTYQSTNKALSDLTVFGQSAASVIYVFPGWVDYGSGNANLSFQATPPLLDQLETSTSFANVKVDLSDAARDTIESTLKDDLGKCQGSNSLAPPGCPLKVLPIGLVDGTAQWGPATIDGRTSEFFSPYQMTVNIIGTASASLTAQSTYVGTTTRRVTGVISATADLSTDPPTLTYK